MFIARYCVRVGHRMVWIYIRPENTQNLSSYATRFSTAIEAENYVWSLSIPNLHEVKIYEVKG